MSDLMEVSTAILLLSYSAALIVLTICLILDKGA